MPSSKRLSPDFAAATVRKARLVAASRHQDHQMVYVGLACFVLMMGINFYSSHETSVQQTTQTSQAYLYVDAVQTAL